MVLYLVDTHGRPWIDPEPALDRPNLDRPWIDEKVTSDRCCVDPGSTPNVPRGDPGSILGVDPESTLDRSPIEPGSTPN